MDQYRLVASLKAASDTQRDPRDADGQRHDLTPEQLDALADVWWRLPDLKGVLAAGVNAVRLRWRLRVSHRIEPTPVPSAAVPSPG